MGVLYIECKMGVAGDMLTAALLDICPEPEKIVDTLNSMGLEGVEYALEKSEKCGITGNHMKVTVKGEEEESHDHHNEHDHEEHAGHDHHHDHEEHTGHEHQHHHHAHRSMKDIENIVSELKISEDVKQDVLDIYKIIAGAESKVHGKDVSEIHFHEVGSMDAIADITAVCLLMKIIAPEKVIVSPIHVGSGHVHCAHGILPVPAPATALILTGIPSYSGDIRGELCTPTGAALIKHFADGFGAQPVMSIDKIGYGMGKKDFARANCVRVMIGEKYDEFAFDSTNSSLENNRMNAFTEQGDTPTDKIVELICNIDDMTSEEIGFATEQLMEAGAADAFTCPIGMKKNRPATMLTVLCKEELRDQMVRQIFKLTTTIGIREHICKRYILSRRQDMIETDEGTIRVKKVSGYGVSREKKEYDDLAVIARKHGCSLKDANNMVEKNA